MILRGDGDFAHPSADGACGIAHGGAEQFRQGDEGHGPRSPNKAISSLVKNISILSVVSCILMRLLRSHLARIVGVWLVCQFAVLAAAPLSLSAKLRQRADRRCCAPADRAVPITIARCTAATITRPTKQDPHDCAMRSADPASDVTLTSLIGGLGLIPPSQTAVATRRDQRSRSFPSRQPFSLRAGFSGLAATQTRLPRRRPLLSPASGHSADASASDLLRADRYRSNCREEACVV